MLAKRGGGLVVCACACKRPHNARAGDEVTRPRKRPSGSAVSLRMSLNLCLVPLVLVVTLTRIAQSGGQLEIGILSGFSSTLHYLHGNCSWRVTINAAGNEVENEVGVGPQRTLVGGDGGSEGFTLKCVTEEGEKLNAIIITHGKGYIDI